MWHRARLPRTVQGWKLLQTHGRDYAYAGAITVAALVAAVAVGGTSPSAEDAYAPLGLAVLVGLLLTVRVAPERPAGAMVLLPAMVFDIRFGAAALPAVAYMAIVANLIRGLRGPRVISTASHLVLAFAVAHACAELIGVLPGWIVFSLVFALGRLGLWHLAERLDTAPPHPRAEHPEILLSLPLAPIGLLPLAAGDRLGDGAEILAMAAVLALLFVVREAANLATARAEMESERDRLARANALQDDLMHLITHELRNPLTLVMSYSQMARRAAADESYETIPGYISQVERAGRSIQRLMENLLQLSKLELSDALPPPEPIDLPMVINQVAADLMPLAKQKHQNLEIEPGRGVAPALGVPLLLREALSNLVSNAVKYTPEGGAITVWTESGSRPDTVVLGVRDTGIGLASEDLDRLFTKFFRSADPRVQRERGSGLGLALTHTMVLRMGGHINVVSAPGEGTTFRLTLPARAA